MLSAAVITAVLIAREIRRARPESQAPTLRILAEHVVDMVSAHDADGTFRYASPVLAGMVGGYSGTLIGRHPRDLAHPDDATALAGIWRRAVRFSGTPAYVTWRCRRHDGQFAWLETTARATPKDATALGAIVCGSRDVTERKQIEDALRDSEQRFRTTLETVRLVAVGIDAQARITFCNESFLTLTGWSRAELLGENWFDRCVAPGDPSRASFFDHIGTGDIPPKSEHEILCRDESRRMIEWDTTVLRSPAGEVMGTASLGADVTERRHEEATLKLLQEITVSVSSAKDLKGALVATLESLCAATGWMFGEAWLPTADNAHLERTTVYALPGVEAQPLVDAGNGIAFAPGEGLPGLAWQSRQVEWFPDLAAATPARARLQAAAHCGFHSAVAVPVMSGTEVVAILGFFMDRPRATDARHTQMTSLVAGQVGAMIERRRAQKMYEAEILRARDEAQAASHAKSDFLSRMSHELRTPLNSVIGFAGVMKKNKSGHLTEEELTYLDRITSNGRHLLTLVNNVLDIAKVEAGRLTVTSGIVTLDALIIDVVEQMEGQPRPAGVDLRAEVPEDMAPVETDTVLLRQVLINLAGNALRFTHQGSVVVGAQSDAHGVPVCLYVRDTGIGITVERQEAIFEPFEQAAPDTHRSYGGTGLGLSISRAICDALGYRLTLASAPGKGSTFTVHLTA
ncbi:MAG: PAS domain S-box protein [Gemmatimonadaceae bacterium]